LPQQAQQSLFLLAVLAWILVPQMLLAPPWVSAFAAVLLLWRSKLALRSQALPSRWTLSLLLALAITGTLWTYQNGFSRDAGVTLVVLLLALKTMEMRAQRDAFVVFFLGFFAVLTQFFSSQSLATAAYMLVAILGLLTALISAHMPGSTAPLRVAALTSLRLAVVGTPVMVLLFVFFPRVAPLWGVDNVAPRGRSGLAASMSVGSMAELALDDSIALRLKFTTPVVTDRDFYFRGPVLSRFDGRQWLPLGGVTGRGPGPDLNIQIQGVALRYELTMEPSSQPWLLTLEATPEAPQGPDLHAKPTADLQWLPASGAGRLRRYQVQSYLQFTYGPRQWIPELGVYTALPPQRNPRTLAWAAQLHADPRLRHADASTLSAAVLQRLGDGEYRYTLLPGLFGEETADEFWFDKKAGFCEHIASAYVVTMRALGVPARIITGYQGAHRNAIDGYWTVRNSDAHAWAEIWQEGRGWIRVDPTAAVSPWRVQAAARLSAPASPVTQFLGTVGTDLWTSARSVWEAVNNQWNQSVLSFGSSTQFALLKQLGFDAPGWEQLGYVLAGLTAAGAGCFVLWTARMGRQKDPMVALLDRTRRKLSALGLALPPQATAREMARLAEIQWGSAASMPLQEWLKEFERLRYGRTTDDHTLEYLRTQWRRMSWPKTLKNDLSTRLI